MTEEHVEQLLRLEVDPPVSPENTLLMVQAGDEVLDYRIAVEKYQKCRTIVQPGAAISLIILRKCYRKSLTFCHSFE